MAQGGENMMEQIEAVQRMQDYIKEHLYEDIKLADLARVSLYSPWYSHRLFQQWLNDVKKAKILSDGIPGNRTYAFAKKYKVGYGNDNYAAKYVQNRLKQFNLYSGKCDGEPRSLTVNSIKKFESLYGLKIDGVISGTDWYYILAKEV